MRHFFHECARGEMRDAPSARGECARRAVVIRERYFPAVEALHGRRAFVHAEAGENLTVVVEAHPGGDGLG